MTSADEARVGDAMAVRPTAWLRGIGRWSARLVLLVVVVLELAYLARRPLLEGWLRRTLTQLVGEALGARVEIGSIRGDWVTTVFVDDVQVNDGRVLRRLEGGHLAVQVDPLRLLWHGDLAGIRRARVQARVVEIAWPAGAEAEAAPADDAPPDLGTLTRLLPEGAEVDVADFTLRDGDSILSGPVRAHIGPAPSAPLRPFSLAAPGVTAAGELRATGEIAATARTDDVAHIVRFFAPTADLAGGRVEALARVRLAPGFSCAGGVHTDGLRIAGRDVRRASGTVALDETELRIAHLDLDTDGVRARVRDGRLPLVEPPLPTAGDVSLSVADLSPFASLLPEVLRAQLPIRGNVRARVVGPLVYVDDSRLECAAGSLHVHAGALALGDTALARPLQFEARITDFDPLPLPPDLPVRPLAAAVQGSLGVDTDGALVLATDVAVDARDEGARTLAARGLVRVSLQPFDAAWCDLELSGSALALPQPTRMRATARWNDTLLTLQDVHLTQTDRDVATASATIPLTGGLSDLLRTGRVDVRVDDLDLGAVLRAAGAADLDLHASGTIALGDARLTTDLTGSTVIGRERLAFTGALAWQDDALTVTRVQVEDAYGGRATLHGTVGLAADLDWQAALRQAADLQLELLDVDPLRLAAEPEPAGGDTPTEDLRLRVSGSILVKTRGTTDLRADLHATGFVDGAPDPAHADLSLTADADTTKVDDLEVRLGPTTARGAGTLAWSPASLLADGDAGRALDAAAQADLTLDAMTVATITTWLGVALPFDEIEGTLSGDAHLRGTPAAPDLRATARLASGRLRTADGERLDDIAAELSLTPSTLEVVEARATRGKGPIKVTGSVRAPGPWWQSWPEAEAALIVDGDNVLLQRKNGVKVRADLDLHIDGPLRDLAVSGRVGLRDSKLVTRVPFFDLRRTGGAATSQGLTIPGVELPEPVHARLDVAVVTAEPFAIKTNVLDGKLDAQLQLLGSLAEPRLLGTVSGPDAAVILPGVRMRATTLLLQFTAEAPRRPTLTLNARGRRHGFDVQVNARGPYDRPDIVLHSDPVLPPEDLVVLVTTGARPEALRSTTGVGTVLGAYLAEEFADWIFGSESTEAKESFLDRFTIETGTEMSSGGTESIVVEFRVGNRFYLQGERDVYEDINMGVVYRIRFR
ncbi:MAG: translocation/assembly module TamB domain-containing protein [Planctomycetota bacterium]